jgi:5'/3'-nucleotidase SurE
MAAQLPRPFQLALMLALALTLTPPAHADLCGTGPLDILLTNDDGYQAPGIRALYVKLRADGHRVLLVAPDRNLSGSSASFTWGKVPVTRDPSDPNVFAVGGTPSTAVALGATALYPPDSRPDLVVSGINIGANVGSLLAVSGTVGAALAGTMLLDPPIPGLAISAERAGPGNTRALPSDHLDQVAAHAASVIAATRTWFCQRDEVSRARTVLNVNYPALPVAEARGTVVASQGRSSALRVRFEATGADEYTARATEDAATVDSRDADITWLENGYVTVTPIEGRFDDGDPATRDLGRRLRKLRP